MAEQALGVQVSYSAGKQAPVLQVPKNACDSHVHIFDPVRFPYIPADTRNQAPATVPMLRLLMRRLGLTRAVVVTPGAYGLNNDCTLDALTQLGGDGRGIALLDNTVDDAELEVFHAAGIRGVRFNILGTDPSGMDTVKALAPRLAEMGWHAQFHMSAEAIVAHAAALAALPGQMSFDHFARIPFPAGTAHPAFSVLLTLLDAGNTWIKLSGMYLDSKAEAPAYADSVHLGWAFVKHASERMLWGSDWPHPAIFSGAREWPDDAAMLDRLDEMTEGDATLQERILVTNPAILYDF